MQIHTMMHSHRAVAWMQIISATKARAKSHKSTQSSVSCCSSESHNVEERLLPGWTPIITFLPAFVQQEPGSPTPEQRAGTGTVDQASVEEQGQKTEEQLGEELN